MSKSARGASGGTSNLTPYAVSTETMLAEDGARGVVGAKTDVDRWRLLVIPVVV